MAADRIEPHGQPRSAERWEHFPHGADIGVRGIGATKAEAFAQAAMAMTAAVTELELVAARDQVDVACAAPDDELLFYDWMNAIVYEMTTRSMLFSRFTATLADGALEASLWGEKVEVARHCPAVEVKGATFTELKVGQRGDGSWCAQCVIDI